VGKLIEFAKQLQALVAAVLPVISTNITEILPFLNPQIGSDMAAVSCLLTLVISLVVYNLSKPAQSPATARLLMLFGVALALGSLLMTLMIFDKILLSTSPDWQDLAVRSLYVLFFIGTAAPLGWITAILLN
jgi:hypothetical protein